MEVRRGWGHGTGICVWLNREMNNWILYLCLFFQIITSCLKVAHYLLSRPKVYILTMAEGCLGKITQFVLFTTNFLIFVSKLFLVSVLYNFLWTWIKLKFYYSRFWDVPLLVLQFGFLLINPRFLISSIRLRESAMELSLMIHAKGSAPVLRSSALRPTSF